MIKEKKEILELFDIANESPELAKNLIEPQINTPYQRELANDITRDKILNLSDYDIQNYYHDKLYKLWNYAEKIRKERLRGGNIKMEEKDNKNYLNIGVPGTSSKGVIFKKENFKKELAPFNAKIEEFKVNGKSFISMYYEYKNS